MGRQTFQPLLGVQEPSHRLGSGLMFRKCLCQSLVVPPRQRILIFILSLMVVRVAESQLEVHPPVPLTLGKRGTMGVVIFDVSQSLMSSPSSSSSVQAGIFLKFMDQWKSLLPIGLCLIWLRCCPLLFHSFRQFNIEATPAHYPIIQKDVNELLAKGAIEACTGGTGLCSNTFLVP